MQVAFTKLIRPFKLHQQEYEQAALRALRSGWYILGDELTTFEDEFAGYIGTNHCVGVNSGLDALILSLRALGIGPGDEVIVPANTYIATVLSITENGATPVFVEPDEYFNIDADKIETAITPRTKAAMSVHLYGQACNMKKIVEVARLYNLHTIEDCAQSHGACYSGTKTGAFSTIGCFSFYPTKPLGAFGDAGALVTNDDEIANKLKMLRNYGSKVKYVNETEGVNTRMDELQASLLHVGLNHLEEGNEYRSRIAVKYLNYINNRRIILPKTRDGADHIYHQFPILCRSRDNLQQYLLDKGIGTAIHYPTPPHLAECYKHLGYKAGDFPISERYACEELSLPIYAGMPHEEVEYVIKCINGYEP